MPRIREIAQFHTIAFSLVKRDHGEDEHFHTLYLLDNEKNPVAYEPFLEYVHTTGRAKSLAWQKESAFSLGLFIDFIAAKDKVAKNSVQATSQSKTDSTSWLPARWR